jgi:hypothetical protein
MHYERAKEKIPETFLSALAVGWHVDRLQSLETTATAC